MTQAERDNEWGIVLLEHAYTHLLAMDRSNETWEARETLCAKLRQAYARRMKFWETPLISKPVEEVR